jgi:hypothetical protein
MRSALEYDAQGQGCHDDDCARAAIAKIQDRMK